MFLSQIPIFEIFSFFSLAGRVRLPFLFLRPAGLFGPPGGLIAVFFFLRLVDAVLACSPFSVAASPSVFLGALRFEVVILPRLRVLEFA